MASDELLRTLIADFQERWVPAYVEREATIDLMAGKVATIHGPRRAGKTYLLYQLAAQAQAAGLPREAILYVNFEDERILPVESEGLGRLVDIFRSGVPKTGTVAPLVLLDEVQNIPDWQVALRRQVDLGDLRIVVTGSSADLHARELSTRLRGRALSHELLPFGFRELARARDVDLEGRGTQARLARDRLLRDYLLWGGYPEVWLRADGERLRRKLLQDYFAMTFYRDLVDRHGVSNTDLLRHLLKYLAANAGTLFSVNRFHGHLKAQGIAAGRDSLHRYLEHAEEALLFHPISIHSRSVKEQRVNPRKIYCVDTGLRNAVSPPGHPDIGRLAEGAVYLELRRRGYEVTYWRDGLECDFVADRGDGAPLTLQVTWDLSSPEILGRELAGLRAATAAIPNAKPLLLAGAATVPARLHPPELRLLAEWLAEPAL